MLPLVSQDPAVYKSRIMPPKPGLRRRDILSSVIGAALAVVLARRGWTLDASPGELVVLSREGLVIRPFEVMPGLLDGRLTGEEWQRTCDEAGIVGVDLSDAATQPS